MNKLHAWSRPLRRRLSRTSVLLILFLLCARAHGQAPVEKWIYQADSTLYASPLAAPLHPAEGLEVVISDSEARRLVCVDARGKELWRHEGGWTKRLTSGAAFSDSARPGQATLAVGGSDGKLVCLDGETGQALWRRDAGIVTWGGVLWIDLDGDGMDELVAGTEDRGVVALNADGETRWRHQPMRSGQTMAVNGALAAWIDSNGTAHIMGADPWGLFRLDAQGNRVWVNTPRNAPAGGPVVADADGDGSLEAYALRKHIPLISALNPEDGTALWEAPLMGAVDSYAAASLALGDLDSDGIQEIVASDAEGHVHAFDAEGVMRWVYPTWKATHGAPTIEDVDGDGKAEILVASGDHFLYCLDGEGRLEWKYRAEKRLMYPATAADVDADGHTDILLGGSGRRLICLTLDTPHRPARLAWPTHRGTAARRGWRSAPPNKEEGHVPLRRPLFPEGGFEQGRASLGGNAPEGSSLARELAQWPEGWSASMGGEWCRLDGEETKEGARAFRIEEPVSLSTRMVQLPGNTHEVAVSLRVKPEAVLYGWVEWFNTRGSSFSGLPERTEERRPLPPPLPAGETDAEGWTRYALPRFAPPRDARWMRVGLLALAPPVEGMLLDALEIVAHSQAPREAEVLVNQVGYEQGAPKRFTVQANWPAAGGVFSVSDTRGQIVFEAPLEARGAIRGHYGNDWGHHYFRGDFSDWDAPGRYRVIARLDGHEALSWPFEIGESLLWKETAAAACLFFYYQRCGMAVPGFHGACHLDDAAGPDGKQYACHGGWHDAGDYNTYHNAPYVYGLLRAHGWQAARFAALQKTGMESGGLMAEITWGLEHVARMVAPDGSARGPISSGYGYWGPPELETDNQPGTGDERRMARASGDAPRFHYASLARAARVAPRGGPWLEAAERGIRHALREGQRDLMMLSAALDLHAVTGDPEWRTLSEELLRELDFAAVLSPALVDVAMQADRQLETAAMARVQQLLESRVKDYLALSRNPFGVLCFGAAESPNFFNTPPEDPGWHVGTNSHLLEAATLAALSHVYTRDPETLAFVYDQLNWVLGNNPYNISLMEGCGSRFAPTYHHRYAFSGVERGAVPGGIVNGITWRGPGADVPYFDVSGVDIPAFESNEVWLPHNTHYLNAMSALRMAREQSE